MPRPITKTHATIVSPPPRHTALVTGGSGGIGRAICLAFGAAGWQVGVHYHTRPSEAEHAAGAVKDAGGDGFTLQADLRKAVQVEAMLDRFLARCGCLSALICNAGETINSLLLRLKPEQWQAMIETNLTGTFYLLRAAGPILCRQRDGAVVVVGSYAAHQGRTGQAGYAASKAGLLGLMRSAAHEWGPDNVRVNAVFPGWHRTDLSDGALPNAGSLDDHLLRRTPSLPEVARSIVHLATLKDVSGQVWNLDSRIL